MGSVRHLTLQALKTLESPVPPPSFRLKSQAFIRRGCRRLLLALHRSFLVSTCDSVWHCEPRTTQRRGHLF